MLIIYDPMNTAHQLVFLPILWNLSWEAQVKLQNFLDNLQGYYMLRISLGKAILLATRLKHQISLARVAVCWQPSNSGKKLDSMSCFSLAICSYHPIIKRERLVKTNPDNEVLKMIFGSRGSLYLRHRVHMTKGWNMAFQDSNTASSW